MRRRLYLHKQRQHHCRCRAKQTARSAARASAAATTASVSSVIISGGTVEAIGHGGGAGIGGGSNTTYSYVHYGDTDGARTEACVGKIAISGANTVVKATGGTGIGIFRSYGGAGIGSGYPTANNARSVAL